MIKKNSPEFTVALILNYFLEKTKYFYVIFMLISLKCGKNSYLYKNITFS